MVREAFDTRKWFLGVSKVASAGRVGTIKHCTMTDDGVETLNGGTQLVTVVKMKNMAHTHEVMTSI